jgi:hypothetical protein
MANSLGMCVLWRYSIGRPSKFELMKARGPVGADQEDGPSQQCSDLVSRGPTGSYLSMQGGFELLKTNRPRLGTSCFEPSPL